jgi:hypothetical protein
LLVLDQGRRHVGEHGVAVLCGDVEFPAGIAMAHF